MNCARITSCPRRPAGIGGAVVCLMCTLERDRAQVREAIEREAIRRKTRKARADAALDRLKRESIYQAS